MFRLAFTKISCTPKFSHQSVFMWTRTALEEKIYVLPFLLEDFKRNLLTHSEELSFPCPLFRTLKKNLLFVDLFSTLWSYHLYKNITKAIQGGKKKHKNINRKRKEKNRLKIKQYAIDFTNIKGRRSIVSPGPVYSEWWPWVWIGHLIGQSIKNYLGTWK